jgi:hypothetical protein
VRALVFIIAVVCAVGTVAACGTQRQASASHPADSAASTATSRARTLVSLTALSNGTTVRLFRGQSVSDRYDAPEVVLPTTFGPSRLDLVTLYE